MGSLYVNQPSSQIILIELAQSDYLFWIFTCLYYILWFLSLNCQTLIKFKKVLFKKMYLFFLVSLSSAAIVLPNCQIANLITSTCITCNTGYLLVNNQCQWQTSGQLTISNQFRSTTGTQNTGTTFGQNSQNSGGYGSNGQVFIPGYVQPNQQSTSSGTSSASQLQNQYLIDLFNYLSSQQNSQYSNTATTSSSSGSQHFDPNCKNLSGTICIQCYKSYYFNRTQGKCLSVNPQCKEHLNGLCTVCYEGYTLENGNCVVDRSYKTPQGGDLNCKVKSSMSLGGCLECYPSFYFNFSQNKCVGVNPQCKEVTKNNQCTACWAGYDLKEGNCLISSTQETIAPSYPQTSTGANQNQGFITFLDQYFSGSSSSNPSQATTTTQRYGDYLAEFDSSGKLVRIYASPQSSPTTSQLQSQGTSSACTHFYNNLCQGCLQGYYLSSNGCMPIDANCLTWTSTNRCSQCRLPYQLSLSGCVLASTSTTTTVNRQDECFYREVKINGVCTAVSNDCKEWNSMAQCTVCYPGYTLTLGRCGL